MALIDETYSQLDKTVKLFDNFYNFDVVVNSTEYELVFSYFYDLSGSKQVARNFSAFLFRISNITGQSIVSLLDYLKGKSKLEANSIIIYYLNALKSKTTLYGIGVEPIPNEPVNRNIIV